MYDLEPLQVGQGVTGDLGAIRSSTVVFAPPFQVNIGGRPQKPQFITVDIDHQYGRAMVVEVDISQ